MTKEEFLKDVGNWSNHRYLLWPALEATKHMRLPVLELGCGDGSTPYLQAYCKVNNLELFSYDYNKEWADKYNAIQSDWSDLSIFSREYSVALVDESPGEHRKESIPLLTNTKIIVCHDTEPPADHGYKMRDELKKFKFMIDLKTDEPGAWASAVSNVLDVTKWEL